MVAIGRKHVCLGSPTWQSQIICIASDTLLNELSNQILSDGGHEGKHKLSLMLDRLIN